MRRRKATTASKNRIDGSNVDIILGCELFQSEYRVSICKYVAERITYHAWYNFIIKLTDIVALIALIALGAGLCPSLRAG